MSDCVICIYTSDNYSIFHLLKDNNIDNILVSDTLSDILSKKFVDILFVCDDKSNEILKYIDIIKDKFENIKIICVVKDSDKMLANKLIEYGCDSIIRQNKKCKFFIKTVIDKIKHFIKIYDIDKQFKKLNSRRRMNLNYKYKRRKSDYTVANYVR